MLTHINEWADRVSLQCVGFLSLIRLWLMYRQKDIVSYARVNQLSVIAVDWTLTDGQREIAMLHFGISKFTT